MKTAHRTRCFTRFSILLASQLGRSVLHVDSQLSVKLLLHAIQQICNFIGINGDSLLPLSGLDDLVIHLFLVDPEREVFSYIIIIIHDST